MHEFCRDGGKGAGYDSANSCYVASCGNYDSSGLKQVITCTGDATYTGGSDGACLVSGEEITVGGVLQNVTAAIQRTCKGGTVYLPRGIYVSRGCNTGACPTTIGNEYKLRHISIHSGIRLLGEGGKDLDGPEVNGRTGTWILIDHGRHATGADPDGSTVVIGANGIHVAPRGAARQCTTPTGNVCDTDGYTAVLAETDSAWGNASTVQTDMLSTQNGIVEVCVDNSLASTGTCSGRRTVNCTSDAICTSNSIGTCQGFVTAVEAAIDAGEDAHLLFTTDHVLFDNTQATNGVSGSLARVRDAEDSVACAANSGEIYLGRPGTAGAQNYYMWPFYENLLDISEHTNLNVRYLDYEKWYQGNGYNLESINVMPQNWYGRDSSDNNEDCTVGTEAACDSSQILRISSTYGGGVKNCAFWYMSTEGFSNMDSGNASMNFKFHNNLIARIKRGVGSDMGAWDVRDNVWLENESRGSALILTFNSNYSINGDTFVGNQAAYGFLASAFGRGNQFRNLRFLGSNRFVDGIFRITAGSFGLIENILIQSHSESPFMIDPTDGETVHAWTIRNVNIYGGPNANPNAAQTIVKARAIVNVSDQGSSNDGGGSVRNILIDNVHAETMDDTCFIWFDAGDDDAAGLVTFGIDNITQANPGVVTAAGHNYSNGDTVYISGVVGMTEVNTRTFTVAGVAGNDFNLDGEDTSGYGAYIADPGDLVQMTKLNGGLGVEAQMAGIAITNSSLESTDGKFACFGRDNNSSGGEDIASGAADVLKDFITDPTSRLPYLQNNMLNGVPYPDFPYRVQAAAGAGDCDLLPAGSTVAIYDDTAIGACTDAGADGVLDGGGSSISVCICDGAGGWTQQN